MIKLIMILVVFLLSGCALEFGQAAGRNGFVVRNAPLYCYSPSDIRPVRCFQSVDRCLLEERFDPFLGFNPQFCRAIYP